MKKSSEKDFLAVLQNLETILQAQTKTSREQSSRRTSNNKAISTPKKSPKKKTTQVDFQETNTNKEIRKILSKSPSPQRPRKLYKNTKNNDLYMTPNKYSTNTTPKNREKSNQNRSPQVYRKKIKHSPQQLTKQSNRRIRHNSPVDEIDNNINNNEYHEYSPVKNYTSNQLNTLCIFFLRWMKRCTEKIEAESNMKTNSQSIEKAESNYIQNNNKSSSKILAESDEISIERINCKENSTTDQIPIEKIEINFTPKSFKSSTSSSIDQTKNNKETEARKKHKSKVTFNPALTPQQQKKYLDYLQTDRKPNQSQDNSLLKSNEIQNNQNKETSTKIQNNNNEIEIINISKNRNNNTTTNNDKNEKNDSNIVNNTNELNSTEESCKLILEETSPLPKQNDARKMPSIGESDLNNHPNSEDIHYDSYELSEKSLSLLPPQGEGEVTDFNPSKL